ncbi:MAG: HEAT repeat domain-containing protein [Planctomycetes bacterium]|nr:HEAT repeat domain-containing protein [Planctomycetota bacterium]
MSTRGNSRFLLLAALGAAVVVVVASGWYLVSENLGPGDGDDPDGDGSEAALDGPVPLPPGAGRGGARKTGTRAKNGEQGGDEGGGELELGADSRDPFGASFDVTPDSMRDMLARREWAELRRQVDVYQQDGKALPEELVRALVELLKDDGLRLDAVLVLGLARDGTAGRLLADLSVDTTLPVDVRVAALQALAKSGQSDGLAQVRRLVDGAAEDSPVTRQALFALAAMGGADAVAPLLGALAAHANDDLTDAVLTALAKSKGSDEALAQTLSAARTTGDAAKMELMISVGTRMGAASGAALRTEIRRIVESPVSLSAIENDPETVERLRFGAIWVASAMGGDALDAVMGVIRSESGPLRQTAVNSLRNARGDDAAQKILAAFGPDTDQPTRYEFTAALGATGSTKATTKVLALLDDPDGAVREAASAAIAGLKDPAAVTAVVARLERSRGDRTIAINLINTLGSTGVKDGLPTLKALLDSKDTFWQDQQPWIRRAIARIESGNPDSDILR